MNERIKTLTQAVLDGQYYPETKQTEYDREDLLLPDVTMTAKRLCEYMLNQEPFVHSNCRMAGFIRFDGSVEADVFTRIGHKHFGDLWHAFYNKPVNNLITFEWEHAAANFDYIVKDGIDGVIARIEASKKQKTQRICKIDKGLRNYLKRF